MKKDWTNEYGIRNFANFGAENFFIIARELLKLHDIIEEREEFHYIHEMLEEPGNLLNDFTLLTYFKKRGVYCKTVIRVMTPSNMKMHFYLLDSNELIFQGNIGLHKGFYVFEKLYIPMAVVPSFLLSVDTLESIDFYERLEELEEDTIRSSNIF